MGAKQGVLKIGEAEEGLLVSVIDVGGELTLESKDHVGRVAAESRE